MNKDSLEQLSYCIEVKRLCNELITKLYLIENVKRRDFEKYSKQLNHMKERVNDIYWSI